MARRRFFVPEIRNGEAAIRGDEAQHFTRVLRVEAGQKYEISDNHAVYLAEIVTARKSEVSFRALERIALRPAVVRVHLYAALIKFDHFEWMLEKATELGVERITPVRAQRCERGLEQAAVKRAERWQRIVLEASQQSRRDRLPELDVLAGVAEVAGIAASCRFLCDEEPGGTGLLDAIPAERSNEDTVALLIGPEGGWTDAEREELRAAGWTAVSLGPQILRAETAAMAALAILGAGWARPPVQ